MSEPAKGIVDQPTAFEGTVRPQPYETRIIIHAQGIEFHDEDVRKDAENQEKNVRKYEEAKATEKNKKLAAEYDKRARWLRSRLLPYLKPAMDYLQEKLKDKGFKTVEDPVEIKKILSEHKIDSFESVRKIGLFTSEDQKVKFIIVSVFSKKDFKRALETETPPLHVMYYGHSRYGRGACFDTYTGLRPDQGDQWERGVKGREEETGMFRLGYPYVPVSLHDIETRDYYFKPVPVEDGTPPNENKHPFSRHPHARNVKLRRISIQSLSFKHREKGTGNIVTVVKNLEPQALSTSPSGQYYGLTIKGETYLLLHAGWTKTSSEPYDLGGADVKCRVFCHFGCSSRLHFWNIVRRKEYKGWERPKPPTDKYAYFTNFPPDSRLPALWLYHILTYNKGNKNKPWWDSLEYAKKETNKLWFKLGGGQNVVY